MRRRTGSRARFLVAMLVAALTVGFAAPTAKAAIAVPTGGEGALQIDFQHFYFPLAAKKISANPIPPAYTDFTTGEVKFPVTGGVYDTRTMLVAVQLAGGLQMVKYNSDFSAVEKSIDVTNIRILNGTQLVGDAFGLVPSPAADLEDRNTTNPSRSSTVFTADNVRVNALSAPVLNLYFDTDAFVAGARMGAFKANIEH
jgi:hypothetical protein